MNATEKNSIEKIRSIVIAGNDIHGWAVAARLARSLRSQGVQITIVEPNHAVVPNALTLSTNALDFHSDLGVQEVELLKNVGGVYKYGTRLQNCRGSKDNLFCYSPTGELIDRVKFHHYLSRQRINSHEQINSHERYDSPEVKVAEHSIATTAALSNKFTHPEPNSALHNMDYAFQVDGVRYLHFLAQFALRYGVKRLEAEVEKVVVGDNGFIQTLTLSNGESVHADFFIDATGSKALLIEEALGVTYHDWSQAFGCDRRLEMITPDNSETPLFNTVTKTRHGWFRSIPIQGARHCHFSYSSAAMSEEQARSVAFAEFGQPIRDDLVSVSEQRQGVRHTHWQGNCLAIGEAAGFVEALLFSPLDLTINAIERWLAVYPDKSCNYLLAQEYNITTRNEYLRVADVHALIADSNLAGQAFSSSVEHRLELFRSTGQVAFYESDVLSEAQWINLFFALELWPEFYDPLISKVSDSDLRSLLDKHASHVRDVVARLPKHDQLLQEILKTTQNADSQAKSNQTSARNS